MSAYVMKLGDRRPVLRATLQNADGTAADLTDATAALCRLRAPGGAILVSGAATTDANGAISYALTADDVTALTADLGTQAAQTYALEWRVTFGTSGEATWPQATYDRLVVVARL